MIETDLIDLPLHYIEFFEVVVNSYPLLDGALVMGDLFLRALETVRKVRPAILRSARVIVNYQVISKTRPIFPMHRQCEFFLEGSKS